MLRYFHNLRLEKRIIIIKKKIRPSDGILLKSPMNKKGKGK